MMLINEPEGQLYDLFAAALEQVLVTLAKMIVMDGEGATKFVEIRMCGAATEEEAARRHVRSPTPTSSRPPSTAKMPTGEESSLPSAIRVSRSIPPCVTIDFGDVPILGRNYAIDFSEERAKQVLVAAGNRHHHQPEPGDAAATFWTCDLSKEYVAINANYRT